jgi:hypothetical protein
MTKISLLILLGIYCFSVKAQVDQIIMVYGLALLAIPTLNSWVIYEEPENYYTESLQELRTNDSEY